MAIPHPAAWMQPVHYCDDVEVNDFVEGEIECFPPWGIKPKSAAEIVEGARLLFGARARSIRITLH